MTSDPLPTHLGELELVARLGAGGMASLHLGRRTGPGGFRRLVAVKVLHPHLAEDPKVLRYFEAEARIAAQIRHPGVVQVEALGCQDGVHYIVMEYVAGGTLGRVLKAQRELGKRMPEALAAWIGAQVAGALHAAHGACDEETGEPLGVIHRDVSPHNVLLSQAGLVKLTDFGVAKTKEHLTTAVGALRGKLAYMAPEQLEGTTVDVRADVFSLGVMLWEMLTGERMGRSGDLIEALAQARETAPRVRTRVPRVDAAIDDVVARALSIDRERRFATCGEVQEALTPLAAGVGPSDLLAYIAGLEALPAPAEVGAPLAADPKAPRPATASLAGPRARGGGFFDLPTAPLMSMPSETLVGPLDPPPSSPSGAASAPGPARVPPFAIALGGAGLAVAGLLIGVLLTSALSAPDEAAPRVQLPVATAPLAPAAPEATAERAALRLRAGTHRLVIGQPYLVSGHEVVLLGAAASGPLSFRVDGEARQLRAGAAIELGRMRATPRYPDRLELRRTQRRRLPVRVE